MNFFVSRSKNYMKQNNEIEYSFISLVIGSKNKKAFIHQHLENLIQTQKFFVNEDIDMDSSSYEYWNTYERKLIKTFISDHTHRYSIGELLDNGFIKRSSYTRRKLVYSRYSKNELLAMKIAEERERIIKQILE